MKRVILFPILLIAAQLYSQDLQQVSIDQLNYLLNNANGKTKIVNLWATWCIPCVTELPLFMQAKEELNSQNLEFIFVSLDFQSQSKNVTAKIKENNLAGTLVQLNEKENDWIEKFDEHWEGAIPYTILIKPDLKRVYHYDNFETITDLKTFITNNISH
jgi:thiol-disulfide isomerase/thioredoxin